MSGDSAPVQILSFPCDVSGNVLSRVEQRHFGCVGVVQSRDASCKEAGFGDGKHTRACNTGCGLLVAGGRRHRQDAVSFVITQVACLLSKNPLYMVLVLFGTG